ncbi:MAG TPA: Crp/Fnr family transcriptional regulator [Burkholderiaceae bacterium]|jgi:CRP-like cAMP-binding protein|nr:Crp/Fnr family transcriptional regulator [Burkholderiaceae bacterium]
MSYQDTSCIATLDIAPPISLGQSGRDDNQCLREFTTKEIRSANQRDELLDVNPKDNRLLNALPDADYHHLFPELEPVYMKRGLTLSEYYHSSQYVYFPTSSLLSLVRDSADGSSSEIAVIGNDGLVGIMACLGGESNFTRIVVGTGGFGMRLSKHRLTEEFQRGGALQKLMLHYAQALMAQMSQTAVCNRHHSISQQLCRRLLLSLDRLPDNELAMTQESLAQMLGVRRESVTMAAGKLQQDGLIQYRRGHITVTDRAAMEEQVCECYRCLKGECERLLPISVH